MKFIDLFAGIGGFRLGMESAFPYARRVARMVLDGSNPSLAIVCQTLTFFSSLDTF